MAGKSIQHLGDLTPDPQNARRHTPRNVGLIEDALYEVGAARSIVIDEDGVVLAGNATIEAAAAAGIERVQVVDADGETLVAVRRSGLSEAQKTRLALYDNRAAELAEWDTTVLAELVESAPEAVDGMWHDHELAALIDAAPPVFDPAAEWQGMPEFEQENQTAYRTIHVHFADDEAVADFARLVGQSITAKTKFIWHPEQERRQLGVYVTDES